MTSKKTLEKPLDKILSYKPSKAPRKPEKQPTMDELNQTFKYEGGNIVESNSCNEYDNETN